MMVSFLVLALVQSIAIYLLVYGLATLLDRFGND